MSSLAAREAALLRLDQELEAQNKTAVESADEVLREQEDRLNAILGVGRGGADQQQASTKEVVSARKASARSPRSPIVDRRGSVPTVRTKESRTSAVAGASPRDKKGDAGQEMGTDAVIRLQRAKLKQLTDDLDQSNAKIKYLEEKVAKQKPKDQSAEIARLNKRYQLLEAAREKDQTEIGNKQKRIEELEAEVHGLRRELKEVSKSARQNENTTNTKDLRLTRAQDEIEKYKARIHELELGRKETVGAAEHDFRKLESQVKLLEKQKAEILNAFKKQLKLIDVLKRQKIHMENAKMLMFTEDEFVRTLES